MTYSYGLFRRFGSRLEDVGYGRSDCRMTRVEGRPEIIIKGTAGPSGPWTELYFYAKPES